MHPQAGSRVRHRASTPLGRAARSPVTRPLGSPRRDRVVAPSRRRSPSPPAADRQVGSNLVQPCAEVIRRRPESTSRISRRKVSWRRSSAAASSGSTGTGSCTARPGTSGRRPRPDHGDRRPSWRRSARPRRQPAASDRSFDGRTHEPTICFGRCAGVGSPAGVWPSASANGRSPLRYHRARWRSWESGPDRRPGQSYPAL